MVEWKINGGEYIGLFYGSFVILGTSVGGLKGYFLNLAIIDLIIATLGGMLIGVGLGLLCNAIVSLVIKLKRG